MSEPCNFGRLVRHCVCGHTNYDHLDLDGGRSDWNAVCRECGCSRFHRHPNISTQEKQQHQMNFVRRRHQERLLQEQQKLAAELAQQGLSLIVLQRLSCESALSASMAQSAGLGQMAQRWYPSIPLSAVPHCLSGPPSRTDVEVAQETEPTLRILDEASAFHALHDVEHLPSIQDRIAALQRKGIVLAQWPSAQPSETT